MRSDIIFISCIVYFTLFACDRDGSIYEKTINLDQDFQTQLAATAQLTSIDTLHKVFLSKTVPTTRFPIYDTLKTSIVQLEVSNNAYHFIYNPNNGFYEHPSNIPFIANTTYRLIIQDVGFGESRSEQTLTDSPTTMQIDTIGTIRNDSGTLKRNGSTLSISFNDPPSCSNYYLLEVLGTGTGFNNSLQEATPLTANLYPFSENELIEYRSSKRLFFTDQFLDGRTINFNFNYSTTPGWNSLHSIEVRLTSATRTAYLYQLTTDKNNDARFRRFTEPVISFSNIQNGVGVFSVSSVLSKRF